jgi:3-oxoacyl-[acyl-carrier protein] reductase
MNVVVTGASRGIGRELTLQLANLGHHVIAISRNEKKLNELAVINNKVIAIPFDLANGDFDELTIKIQKHTGVIDALVNNAGLLINKPFLEISNSDLQSVYSANVFGPFKLIQCLVPLMNESTLKHIVNVSSMGGFQGASKFAGLSAYSSSKAAIACLTECLAEELGEVGIKVNALALGAVQTEMLNEAFPGYQAPLTAKEMAEFMLDFVLHKHKYYNGKILPVSVSTP